MTLANKIIEQFFKQERHVNLLQDVFVDVADPTKLWSVHDVDAFQLAYKQTCQENFEQVRRNLGIEQPNSQLAMQTIGCAWGLSNVSKSTDIGSRELYELIETLQHCCGLDHSLVAREQDLLAHQMLHVELPATLACGLESTSVSTTFWESASKHLNSAVSDLLDGDGWLLAKYLPVWNQLAASWTRTAIVSEYCGEVLLGDEEADQFEWFMRQSFRFTDASGRLHLTGNTKWEPALVESMVRVSADPDDEQIAHSIFGKKAVDINIEDQPSSISEWAQVGILRGGWERKSPNVALRFDNHEIEFDVSTDVRLLSVDQPPSVQLDNHSVSPTDEWQVVCWHTDDDCDFLELQINYADDLKFYRHFLLGRDDNFLLIADVLEGPENSTVSYRQTYNCCPNVETLQEEQTREIYLTKGGNIRSLVLPLALSEWQAADQPHQLVVQNNSFELVQSGQGRMYVPLWIDLNPKRSIKPRTWRKLTVSESLEILKDNQAAAYRVHVGNKQWVIFRALGGIGSRTFLGENHFCEFFAGRFRKGAVEEILTVE